MRDSTHLTIVAITFVVVLLILMMSIINIYYYQTIYNDGGTPDYPEGRAWTQVLLSGLCLVFSILSIAGLSYLYYTEIKRADKEAEMTIGIKVAEAEIHAINSTYGESSVSLSKSIGDQMDSQIRDITRVIQKKNHENLLLKKDIHQREANVKGLLGEREKLQNKIDQLTKEITELKDNLPVKTVNEDVEKTYSRVDDVPETPPVVSKRKSRNQSLFDDI